MALSQTVTVNPATNFGHLQNNLGDRFASDTLPLRSSFGRSSLSPPVPTTALGNIRSGTGPRRISAHAASIDIRGGGWRVGTGLGSTAGLGQKIQAQDFSHVCPLCRAGSAACGTSGKGFGCSSWSIRRRQSAPRCSPDSPSDAAVEAPPSHHRPDAPTLQPPFDTFDNVPAFDSPLSENHDGVSSFDSPGLTPDAHIPPFEDTVRAGRVVNKPGLDDPSLAPDFIPKDGTTREGSAEAPPAVSRDRLSRGLEERPRANDDVGSVPAAQAVAAAKPAVLESPADEDLLDQGGLWEQAKRIMAFAGTVMRPLRACELSLEGLPSLIQVPALFYQ